MTNNTRSYLNNKVWYRLLKVVYIFAISIICVFIWFLMYEDTEYKSTDSIEIIYPSTNKLITAINHSIKKWDDFDIDNFKKSNREFENIKENTLKDLTDDIWNVISEWRDINPIKLKELYPELFYNNTKEYINTIDNTLSDLTIQIAEWLKQWEIINIQTLKESYPEIANADNWVLQELSDQTKEWVLQWKIINIDKLRAVYPEFYNLDFIKNYSWVNTIMTQKDEFINPNMKITLMLIWKFILIIWIAYLISELFKRVLYYIVLWSFNPKK
jgi:hypothetical protein